ncbi:MAG: hypothetical protein K0B37_16275 [Bacteroidales bacterium]|nr:hypothetical protein [Bacteroidales bacterium]
MHKRQFCTLTAKTRAMLRSFRLCREILLCR